MELVSISSVGPRVIEPRETLVVEGSGFVEGPAVLKIEGDFASTGMAAAKRRSVEFDAVAIDEGRVETRVTRRMMERLTQVPSLFRGRVTVKFPLRSASSAIELGATLEDVELDLRPGGVGVAELAARRRAARVFLRDLGVEVAQGEGDDGLEVIAVRSGSAALAAGLRVRDKLSGLQGRALSSLEDMAGVECPQGCRFEWVTQEGRVRTGLLRSPDGGWLGSDELTAIVLASLALGFFVAFAAPRRHRYQSLGSRRGDPLTGALVFAGVSIPLLMVPAAVMLTRAQFGATLFLMGLGALALSGAAIFGTGHPLRRAAWLAVQLFAVPAVVIVAGLYGSAVGLWDIVESQEAAPWRWHVWSNPFAVPVVFGALSVLWPRGAISPLSSRAASFVGWLAALPGALLIGAYFLGGWLLPGVTAEDQMDSGLFLCMGCLVYSFKVWGVLVVARWYALRTVAGRRREDTHAGLVQGAALLLVGVAASAFWAMVEIPDVYRVAGQVLATAVSVTFFTSLMLSGLRRARFA